MFVLKSTYESVVQELEYCQGSLRATMRLYSNLQDKWNALVRQINAKGGDAFLNSNPKPTTQFTKEELNKLLMLIHPDKHQGKPISHELTSKVLILRNNL